MEAREHCYDCDKVQSLCICSRVASVPNRTAVTIVQHRLEERHPFGTVRIARLGLSRVAIQRAGRPDDEIVVPRGAAVLFPDADAPVLSALSPAERPAHLVAIDGTWSQASQLRRNHPALRALPAVKLARGEPSNYRIRREPNLQSVSTIEAIVRALKVLEPETPGLDGLLSSFDAMIDDQITRRDEHDYTPRHRAAPRIKKPLPEIFLADGRDLVLLYTELHQPRGQNERFPLRVTAARVGGGELFDALVESPLPPSCGRLRNMELADDVPLATLDRSTLAARMGALVRPTDTIVAWAQSPEPLLRELGFEQPFLSAKHHYANQTEGRLGTLDDVVARLGGEPIEPWAPGRSGRQIANLDRVLGAMRAMSRETEAGAGADSDADSDA